MADQANITRRSILQGFAAAPLLSAPALIATATAAEVMGPADPVFAKYVAFLAHEHRAALVAMHPNIYADSSRYVPMFWFPEAPDVTALMGTSQPSPVGRARTMLHAAGLPIPPKSWF